MKKNLLLLIFSLITVHSFAQQYEHCGTLPALQNQLQRNPRVEQQMKEAQEAAAKWRSVNPNQKTSGGVITIPVVVHVVYKNADQNISDDQVFSQLAVLNADYRRLNADAVNTPSEFDSLAADCEIEFCLATTDPNGNPTSGITRTSTAGGILFGFFGPTDDVKSSTTGGVNPWPTDQYLNIWVCDLIPILAGYAQFPGGDSATDGVVINYVAFGTEGTAVAPYNLGRTTTHEVGHWLGLFHIWGDDPNCVADDGVSDTPLSGDSHSGCDPSSNTCVDSPYDFNDMIQNYMDYSNDDCMNLFTLGQKAVMQSTLATSRLSLTTSPGCSLPAGIANFSSVSHHIYPNPGTGEFYISLSHSPKETLKVSVWDLGGKLITSSTSNSMNFMLDLSAQADGIYFLGIEEGEKKSMSKLILAR